MTRAMISAVFIGLFSSLTGLVATASPGSAQAGQISAVPSHGLSAEEFSAQSRKLLQRAPRRVHVYRGYNQPGPNSVRLCNARYEQEYRPSGTVIVPRVNCYWSG